MIRAPKPPPPGLTCRSAQADRNTGTRRKAREGERMLHRRLHLALGPLFWIAAVSGPGAAQEAASEADRHHAAQCGSYYACIEQEAWQPRPDASADTSPTGTMPKAASVEAPESRASAGWQQHDMEESRP